MQDTPAPKVRMNKRLARALKRLSQEGRVSAGSAQRLETLGLIQTDLFTGLLTITDDGRQQLDKQEGERRRAAEKRLDRSRSANA